MMAIKRYALVRGNDISEEQVANYLPPNYKVEGVVVTPDRITHLPRKAVVIGGWDNVTWTLDWDVAEGLGCRMMLVEEIDFSHPAMKLIPEQATH